MISSAKFGRVLHFGVRRLENTLTDQAFERPRSSALRTVDDSLNVGYAHVSASLELLELSREARSGPLVLVLEEYPESVPPDSSEPRGPLPEQDI